MHLCPISVLCVSLKRFFYNYPHLKRTQTHTHTRMQHFSEKLPISGSAFRMKLCYKLFMLRSAAVVVVHKKRVAAQITPLSLAHILFVPVFIIEIQISAFEFARWQTQRHAAASAAVTYGACVSSFSLILWKLTFCYLIWSELIRLVCFYLPSLHIFLPVLFTALLACQSSAASFGGI